MHCRTHTPPHSALPTQTGFTSFCLPFARHLNNSCACVQQFCARVPTKLLPASIPHTHPCLPTQAQRLADLEEENAALKAAGNARGRVLKQSRAVIDAYLQRSVALSSEQRGGAGGGAGPPAHEAEKVVEAVDTLTGDPGSKTLQSGHVGGAREVGGLVPAMDGITTG